MGTIRQLQPAVFPPPHSSSSTAVAVTMTCNDYSSSQTVPQPHKHRRLPLHSSSRLSTHPSAPPLSWSLLNQGVLIVLVCMSLTALTLATPVFVDNPSLAQFQSGRNIRHLPCIVRKSGRAGVCMFAIDCIKQNGTHLGTCIDRFYFGSCCQLKDDTSFASEISDNSIDQNTISHFAHESTTLPSSALFKHTSEPLLSNSSVVPLPPKNNIGSQNRRPAPSSPTKHSQFVVRTTTRPNRKPTIVQSTTTKAPSRRKPTTTVMPFLTTAAPPNLEQRIELSTSASNKLFTFQMVETTTVIATDAPKTASTPITLKPLVTRRPRPPVTSTSRPSNTTTLPGKRPPPPELTTIQVQKPTTSKRPQSGIRPAQRPLLPIMTTIRIPIKNNTVVPTKEPSTVVSFTSTLPMPTEVAASPNDRLTITTVQTTASPSPTPKPTAATVKVPKPTTTQAPQTLSSSSPVTKRPKPTKMVASSTTADITRPQQLSSQTPRPTTNTIASHSTEELSTLSPKPGLVTWTDVEEEPVTNATRIEEWSPRPPGSQNDWLPVSTIAPEVITNKTTADLHDVSDSISGAPEDSTDRIVISVSTSISELMSNGSIVVNKPERLPGSSITTTMQAPPMGMTTTNSTTTKVPRPHPKPTTTVKPHSTNRITTTTEHSMVTPSSTIPNTTTTSTSFSTPTRTTTASPTTPLIEFTTEVATGNWNNTSLVGASDAGLEVSTEDNFSTGSSTLDYFTEDYNATMEMSTTAAPQNLLEGMDYREICGRRMFPEPRIVGGSNAAFGRWPWQISLRQWRTSTYLHKCGAALLNENWAITAAHCVDNVPPSDLLLRLGEYDLAEEEEPYGYQERRVQIVASHPQFDPRTFEYDLALLRFYEPVLFQPNIIPVCVPINDQDFIGQTAFVTGWGRLYEDGPLPSVLQEVAVPVINNTICETMYRTAGYIEHIPHIFICAGWKKGGYDSCEGDSGGPMVLQREDDKRFQLGGVISWGIGCAEANQPGVYTRISEFRDWINQILQF